MINQSYPRFSTHVFCLPVYQSVYVWLDFEVWLAVRGLADCLSPYQVLLCSRAVGGTTGLTGLRLALDCTGSWLRGLRAAIGSAAGTLSPSSRAAGLALTSEGYGSRNPSFSRTEETDASARELRFEGEPARATAG